MLKNIPQPGRYSSKEASSWFGVAPNSFASNKQKYLNELKQYVDYYIDSSNKIIITDVNNSQYFVELIQDDGGIYTYVPEDQEVTITQMVKDFLKRHDKKIQINRSLTRAFDMLAKQYLVGELHMVKSNGEDVTEDEYKTISIVYSRYFIKKEQMGELEGYINGEYTAKGLAELNKQRYLDFMDVVERILGSKVSVILKWRRKK